MIFLFFILFVGCTPYQSETTASTGEEATSATVPITVSAGQVYPPSPSVFMNNMTVGTSITFSSLTDGAEIYTSVSAAPQDTPHYSMQNVITLSDFGINYIYAYSAKDGLINSPIFSAKVFVSHDFAECGERVKTRFYKDDLRYWATGYERYIAGDNCDKQWQTPENALGKAKGGSFDIVCLGDSGQITLTFDRYICDGEGADFAVFENGFNDGFLELAFVEVSSNGTDFIRFDSQSLTDTTVDAFGRLDNTKLNNLASKYKNGYGTGFDLCELRYRKEVLNGTVDLNRITHVRIIDIDSTVTNLDSFGHQIYDPETANGENVTSSGFDLDAIGVIHWQYKN